MKTDDLDTNPHVLDKANRMNEQVAVLAGLSCLISFMADNTENLSLDESFPKKI